MDHTPNIDLLRGSLADLVIVRHVDSGGFKAVYEAVIEGRREALKLVYWPEEGDEPEAHVEIPRRLDREIGALRECASPYLVKLGSLMPRELILDTYKYFLYSEEFLEGYTIKKRIRSSYRPDYQECRLLFTCLLDVIDKLKSMDLIHRDLKPENVVELGVPERPYVALDLGIAFKIGSSAITINRNFPLGTLPYMAPEMFTPRFRETLDYRSDLYSAALTIYEFATGINPISQRGDDVYSTINRIKYMLPQRLSQHRPDFPLPFCDLVNQLMHKIPAMRPRLPTIRAIMEGI